MEFLEGDWHGTETHGFWPDDFDNGIDGEGSCFEELADDCAVVVEDCAPFSVALLAFQQDHASG